MDNNTINATYTGQGTATTATPYNYSECCPNRLPCGYCRLMCGMCPLQAHTTITWTSGYADSEMFKVHPESVTYTTTTATTAEVKK